MKENTHCLSPCPVLLNMMIQVETPFCQMYGHGWTIRMGSQEFGKLTESHQ